MKKRHIHSLLSLRNGDVRHLLGYPASGVVNFLAVVENSGESSEVRHVADVRLGVGLEHERGERGVVLGVNLDCVIALRPDERVQLLHLECRRHQLDDFGEERLRAVSELGRAAEKREELLPLHRFLHRIQRVGAGDLLAAQVALEKNVVGCGDRLDELLVVLVELRFLVVGDVHLVVLAELRSLLEEVRLLVEQVEDAVKLGALANRHFYRNDSGRERALDSFEDGIERCVLLVDHRDRRRESDRGAPSPR